MFSNKQAGFDLSKITAVLMNVLYVPSMYE